MGKHAQKRMAPPPPKPVVNRPPSTPTTGPRESAAAGGVVVTSPPLLNLVEPQATTATVTVNTNPVALEARADRLAEIGQLKSLKESTGCVKKVVELCTLSITPLPLGAAKGAALDERTPSTATGKARNTAWDVIAPKLTSAGAAQNLGMTDLVPEGLSALSCERDFDQKSKCSGVYALRVVADKAQFISAVLRDAFVVAMPYNSGAPYDCIE